jgi:hypothetical protein
LSNQSNQHARVVRIGLSLCCAVAATALAIGLAACGDSGSSQEEIDQAKQAGAAHAREQIRIKQIQHELRALRHGNGGRPPTPVPGSGSASSAGSGGASTCGGELSVNSVTTCPFAENVESAYFAEIGSGSGTVYVYSPVTNQTYAMYCTAGSPHECTGGHDAAVYFP